MGWILMQPAGNEESVEATTLLKKTDSCLFNLSLQGPKLKPIAFGLRSCNENEHNFILLLAKAHAVIGISPKIESLYGAAIFIGYAIALPSKKLLK